MSVSSWITGVTRTPQQIRSHWPHSQALTGLIPRLSLASFTELGPQLLRLPDVKYLLSKMFSEDPLEQYFLRQHHCGGSNENSTANQAPYNTTTLVQQQSIYHDLKMMNVEAGEQITHSLQPLPKHPRNHNAHKPTKFTCNFHIVNYATVSVSMSFLYLLTNFIVKSLQRSDQGL